MQGRQLNELNGEVFYHQGIQGILYISHPFFNISECLSVIVSHLHQFFSLSSDRYCFCFCLSLSLSLSVLAEPPQGNNIVIYLSLCHTHTHTSARIIENDTVLFHLLHILFQYVMSTLKKRRGTLTIERK